MSLCEDTGFESRDLCTIVSLKGVALLIDLHHKSSDESETEIEDDDISVF